MVWPVSRGCSSLPGGTEGGVGSIVEARGAIGGQAPDGLADDAPRELKFGFAFLSLPEGPGDCFGVVLCTSRND